MKRIIGLVNRSTLVNKNDAERIAQAVDRQLEEDVCPDLWIASWRCRSYKTEADAMLDGAFPLVIWDKPDVDGAAGYHTDGAGKVFVKPTLDNGGTILSGSNSVSVTASHEAIEMVGDLAANRNVDMGNGSATAEERCDACESQSYTKALADGTDVSVSDYLLNSWFDPLGVGPFDKMNTIASSFAMSGDGDYMIVTFEGETKQTFGDEYPKWKRELKENHGRSAEKRKACIR